jgi:DNA-binding ferritin-like protein
MYQTKNDLPAHTRAEVIGTLKARLADSIHLMHQAKQAPWHVADICTEISRGVDTSL